MIVVGQAVAANGFAARARKLEISSAAVTRLVGDLEDHLGVRAPAHDAPAWRGRMRDS